MKVMLTLMWDSFSHLPHMARLVNEDIMEGQITRRIGPIEVCDFILDVLDIIILDCLGLCNQIYAVSLSLWLLNLLRLCQIHIVNNFNRYDR
jgi:hypothetical protein